MGQTRAWLRPDSKRSSTPVFAIAFCSSHITKPASTAPEMAEVAV